MEDYFKFVDDEEVRKYYSEYEDAYCVEGKRQQINKIFDHFINILDDIDFIEGLRRVDVKNNRSLLCIVHKDFKKYLNEALLNNILDKTSSITAEIIDDKLMVSLGQKKVVDEHEIKKYIERDEYEITDDEIKEKLVEDAHELIDADIKSIERIVERLLGK